MASSGITHLIINSPFAEPQRHWSYQRETLKFKRGEKMCVLQFGDLWN